MQASNPGLGTVLALLASILLGTFSAPMTRIRLLELRKHLAGLLLLEPHCSCMVVRFRDSARPNLVLLAGPAGALAPVFLYGLAGA